VVRNSRHVKYADTTIAVRSCLEETERSLEFSISDVCGTRHGRSVGWRRADYLMGVPATRSCNTHWTLLEKSSRRSPGR